MDPRDFLQKASHAYIVMLDNQNALPEWAADTLCRLVTGESDSKRQLYTDDEDVIVEMLRAILINGINTPSDRGDVQERTLPLELEPIPKNRRQPERVMWAKFQRTHRSVLGAIFSGLSGAMARHREMTFGELPRLADWAEYAMALYEHWGWSQQTFVKDWAEVEGRQVQGAVEGSPVAQAIIGLMREHDSYKKSSSGLLEKLEAAADRLNIDVKREKTWPKSPSWLWRRIQEIKPALAAHTIYAERGEDNSGSYILLTKGAPPEDDGGGSRNGSGSISRYAPSERNR